MPLVLTIIIVTYVDQLKIGSKLDDPSIKLLYQRILEQNLIHSPCSSNINAEWQTLKNALQQAANEALGKRKREDTQGIYCYGTRILKT